MYRKYLFIPAFLLFLGTGCLFADNIPHNFHSMFTAVTPTLTVDGTNKIGTTAEVIYRCTGGSAAFGYDGTPSKLCAKLYTLGATLATSRINDLAQVTMTYLPTSVSNMTLSYSTDSIAWTSLTKDAKESSPGTYVYTFPQKGDYYLKIQRGTDFRILELDYNVLPCACFLVVNP